MASQQYSDTCPYKVSVYTGIVMLMDCLFWPISDEWSAVNLFEIWWFVVFENLLICFWRFERFLLSLF